MVDNGEQGGSTPTEAGGPPSSEATTPSVPRDQGVPQTLVYLGLLVGGVCVLGGIYTAVSFAQMHQVGLLSICIGFGIILAVFGARAEGTWQSWGVAGCGAIAIVLFLILRAFPNPSDLRYVKGDIFQARGVTTLSAQAGQQFLVGKSNGAEEYHFVAFPDDLNSKWVTFNVSVKGNPDVSEFNLTCIDTIILSSTMAAGGRVSFTLKYNGDDKYYYLTNNADSKKVSRFNIEDCEKPQVDTPKASFLNIVGGVAVAQEFDTDALAVLLRDLESENGDERNAAREQLAAQREPASYQLMTSTWSIEDSSYRADLGRLVAWSRAISQNREMAVLVANALGADQIEYLVQLTGQGDITMRQYATEVFGRLLTTTSWPGDRLLVGKSDAIVMAAARVFNQRDAPRIEKETMTFKRQGMEYNMLVSLGYAGCDIKSSYRGTILDALRKYTVEISTEENMEKTSDRLWKLVVMLTACPQLS